MQMGAPPSRWDEKRVEEDLLNRAMFELWRGDAMEMTLSTEDGSLDPTTIDDEVVRFGATVSVEDEGGKDLRWTIVGEDEIAVEAGRISYKSPIGRALIGKEEGDEVVIRTPGALRRMVVTEIWYR